MLERLRRPPTAVVLVLVVIAAAVRMPFWLAYTHAYGHGDAMIWEVWARQIHQHGILNIFRVSDTNNVGYHYVLWPTGAIYARISPEFEYWTPAIRVLVKVPPFVCDLAITVLIYATARRLSVPSGRTREVPAAAAALAFALAPASIYDSMWWSQIDSVNALAMLAAVVLVAGGRPGWGAAVWTLGFLAKPQPIVIVPTLAAFAFWQDGWRALARGVAGSAAVFALALGPWLLHGDARALGETYRRMFAQDPIDLSTGAWNLWSLFDLRGNPNPATTAMSLGDVGISYATASLALCACATLLALAWLRRHRDIEGLLAASALMVFTFYMLPTSTHERYLYPAFALAAPLLVRWRPLRALYGVLALTFFLNLLAINPPNASTFWDWYGTPFAVGVTAFHIFAYLSVMAIVAGITLRAFLERPPGRRMTSEPDAVLVTLPGRRAS